MRALALVAAFALSSLALAGCVANIPDDRFSCVADSDCPSGFTCTAGFCRHSGAPTCSSQSDCDDHVFCNGQETCSATGCTPGTNPCPLGACMETPMMCEGTGPTQPVRFVHADGRAIGEVSFQVAGVEVANLDYGATSGAVALPEGDVRVEARLGDTVLGSTALNLSEPTIVVLRLDATNDHGFALLPDDLPAPSGGMQSLRIVDATLGTASAYNVVYDMVGTGVVSLDRDDVTATVTVAAGERSFGLLRSDGGFDLIAWFANLDLETSTYVVLAGDTQRHLGAPDGPRAILVQEGVHPPVISEPLVYVFDASSDADAAAITSRVYVCTVGASGAAEVPLMPGEISRGVPAARRGPITDIGVALDGPSACAAPTFRVPVNDLQPARRYFVVIAGSAGNTSLRTDLVAEPAYDSTWTATDIGVSFTNDAPELVAGTVDLRAHEAGIVIVDDLPLRMTADLRIPPGLAASGTLDVVGDDVTGTPRTFGPFATPTMTAARDQVFTLFAHTATDMFCSTDGECAPFGGAAPAVCISGLCQQPRLRFVSAPYGSPPVPLP